MYLEPRNAVNAARVQCGAGVFATEYVRLACELAG
jgi:hypothetical protein